MREKNLRFIFKVDVLIDAGNFPIDVDPPSFEVLFHDIFRLHRFQLFFDELLGSLELRIISDESRAVLDETFWLFC